MTGYQTMPSPRNAALRPADSRPALSHGVRGPDRKVVDDDIQALARAARLLAVPTTSVANDGFSGLFMAEVNKSLLPGRQVIDCTSIKSWLRDDSREAVKAAGHGRLVLAGLRTGACVNFPTLDLPREGFKVFVVADACGDTRAEAHGCAMQHMAQAGAVPITSPQFVLELQQDRTYPDTCDGVMDILRFFTPCGIQVRFSEWAMGKHASGEVPPLIPNAKLILKPYLVELAVGMLVGAVYALPDACSPAPPVISLPGILPGSSYPRRSRPSSPATRSRRGKPEHCVELALGQLPTHRAGPPPAPAPGPAT